MSTFARLATIALVSLGAPGCSTCLFLPVVGMPKAKLTLHVVDEAGAPVQNAAAWVSFWRPRSVTDPWKGQRSHTVEGRTDAEGCFSASARTEDRIGFGVEHPGYYGTERSFSENVTFRFDRHTGGRWRPWNPTVEIVLRKIEKPIPMYARTFLNMEIPALGHPVGYDLIKGDWVAPHGNGESADMVFTATHESRSNWDFSASLTIALNGDQAGFAPVPDDALYRRSAFKFPRHAPDTGYSVQQLAYTWGYRPGTGRQHSASPADKNFFFRTRTRLVSNGEAREALYGKLVGPIRLGTSGPRGVRVTFAYCLNPTPNDRNMEFDPDHNLFKGLVGWERVTAP